MKAELRPFARLAALRFGTLSARIALLARLIHDGPAVGYSAPALPLGA